jgi:hypothetical protein
MPHLLNVTNILVKNLSNEVKKVKFLKEIYKKWRVFSSLFWSEMVNKSTYSFDLNSKIPSPNFELVIGDTQRISANFG